MAVQSDEELEVGSDPATATGTPVGAPGEPGPALAPEPGQRAHVAALWHAIPITAFGVCALACGAGLALAGWLLVWTVFFVIGSALVLLVAASWFYVVRRPPIEVEREIQPRRVTKGLPAIAYLHVQNRSRRTFHPVVAVQPYGALQVRTLMPRLSAGQTGVRTYRLPTSRRGVFPIGPVELVRADPFGFAQRVQPCTGSDEIWVLPVDLGLRALPTGTARTLEGPVSDVAQEGSITFHRLREYVVGDDLRMIHWKSVAKTGQLVVRHNIDSPKPTTLVLLDVLGRHYSGEAFEHAVDVAASVVGCALSANSPVELKTTSGDRVTGGRSSGALGVVDYLTTVQPTPTGDLAAQLLALRRSASGTALVVITGEVDVADLPLLASLRRRFQRVVVVSLVAQRRPVAHPGVTIISGTTAAEVKSAWDLAMAR